MTAIFKREFRSSFTSMIGFVFISAFLIIINAFFVMNNIISSTSLLSSVFGMMLNVVLFTVPILTMRVFSEDFKLKTDQLLLTAPVKLGQIVMGKFLAVMGVFILMLVFTLLWPLLITIYGAPDAAEIVGNYVGIILVTAVFVAIGMFISSLTENQLIAAVGSYGLFFMLYILNIVVMSMSSSFPSWAVKVFSFISIFVRYGTITAGLIALDDIVYFLSVAALFLFLCFRVLEKKRWS